MVNLSLIAVAAFLLFYYVISANGVAAANYSISSLRTELASATVEQTDLTLQAQNAADSGSVAFFAVAHGMVLAQEASHISEKGTVALVR